MEYPRGASAIDRLQEKAIWLKRLYQYARFPLREPLEPCHGKKFSSPRNTGNHLY
jgi:hypothetical protein